MYTRATRTHWEIDGTMTRSCVYTVLVHTLFTGVMSVHYGVQCTQSFEYSTRVVDLLSNGGIRIVALLHQRARGQRQHGGAGRSRACGAVCTGAAAVDGASFFHAMHLSNLLPSPSPPPLPSPPLLRRLLSRKHDPASGPFETWRILSDGARRTPPRQRWFRGEGHGAIIGGRVAKGTAGRGWGIAFRSAPRDIWPQFLGQQHLNW